MRLLKKILKGILLVLLLIVGAAGLVCGKEYIESKRIEHIVMCTQNSGHIFI